MKRLTGRAPDGTAYLYNMGGTNAAIDRLAAYEDTGWCYPFLCQPELRAAEQQTVTHWMPLPEPPEEVTPDA